MFYKDRGFSWNEWSSGTTVPILVNRDNPEEIHLEPPISKVYRLIENDGLPVIHIGKRKKVILINDLKEWMEKRKTICQNECATGPVAMKEKVPWGSTNGSMEKTKNQFGGSPTQMQAANELGDLLGLPKGGDSLEKIKNRMDVDHFLMLLLKS